MFPEKPTVDELVLDYLKRNQYISTEISFKRECQGLNHQHLHERLMGVQLENIVNSFCWEKQLENAEIEYLAKQTPIVLPPDQLWDCFDKIVEKIKLQHTPEQAAKKVNPNMQRYDPVGAFSSSKGPGRRRFNFPTEITPKLHCVPITYHSPWAPVHKKHLFSSSQGHADTEVVQSQDTLSSVMIQQNHTLQSMTHQTGSADSFTSRRDISMNAQAVHPVPTKATTQSTNRRKKTFCRKPKRLSDVERKNKESVLNAADLKDVLNFQQSQPRKSLAKVGMKIMRSMKTCAPSEEAASSSGHRDILGELLDANSIIEQQDNIISKTIDSLFESENESAVEYDLAELEMLLNDNSNLSNMENEAAGITKVPAVKTVEDFNVKTCAKNVNILLSDTITCLPQAHTSTVNTYSDQLTAQLPGRDNALVMKQQDKTATTLSTEDQSVLKDKRMINSSMSMPSSSANSLEETSMKLQAADDESATGNLRKRPKTPKKVSPKTSKPPAQDSGAAKTKTAAKRRNKSKSPSAGKSKQDQAEKPQTTSPNKPIVKSKKLKIQKNTNVKTVPTSPPVLTASKPATTSVTSGSSGQSVVSSLPALSTWLQSVSPDKALEAFRLSTATTTSNVGKKSSTTTSATSAAAQTTSNKLDNKSQDLVAIVASRSVLPTSIEVDTEVLSTSSHEQVLPTSSHEQVLPASSNEQVLPASSKHNEHVLPSLSKHKEQVLPASSKHKEQVLPASSKHKDQVLPASSKHKEQVLLASSKHNEQVLPASSKHKDQVLPASSKHKYQVLPAPSKHNEQVLPAPSKHKDQVLPAPPKHNEQVLPAPSKHNEQVLPALSKNNEQVLPASSEPKTLLLPISLSKSMELAEKAKHAFNSTVENNSVSSNNATVMTVTSPSSSHKSTKISDLVTVKENIVRSKSPSQKKKKENRKSSDKVSKKRKRKSLANISLEDIDKIVKKIHKSTT